MSEDPVPYEGMMPGRMLSEDEMGRTVSAREWRQMMAKLTELEQPNLKVDALQAASQLGSASPGQLVSDAKFILTWLEG